MAGAKRHHYVPRSYLERFADGDQVAVRRRDGSTFIANCINVAVESGFYDIVTSGGGKSKEVDEILGDVEGATAGVLRRMDDTMQAPATGTSDRDILLTGISTWGVTELPRLDASRRHPAGEGAARHGTAARSGEDHETAKPRA